ncbi:MAG: response regulator [Ruminococcaceae bacterium]|nr:response regulator [Oscillospiraceae bacterium]
MNVIYVDDEQPALDNFRLTVAGFFEIKSLKLFKDGEEAIEWAKGNIVDVAFLDMEMPGVHGLALALKLREFSPNVRIIFVTAFSRFAMEAWGVDATGYVLKPYIAEDIKKELDKCKFRPLPSQHVVINTIPSLSLIVDGKSIHISGAKTREMFALLIDRADRGITSGEGIAYLWPERPNDSSTQSLFRMTFKRLCDTLDAAGVGNIIKTGDNRRYLRVDLVDCDLYRVLSGDKNAAKKYNGEYLSEYSWAEERNAQLYRMLLIGNIL